MNINDYANEYRNLTIERRKAFVAKLLDEFKEGLLVEYDEYGESVFEDDFMPIFLTLEDEDYFGTEGFKG